MAWTAPRTWVAAETLTAALMNAQVRDNWNAAFPVGSLHWRMQSETGVETTVDGFGLETNGVAVSRTTYSDLQTKLSGLSYPFGSGNGTTTMNLPDLRGRSPVMCGSHADVDIGDSDGVSESSRTPKNAAHTHTGPSHTHTVSITTGGPSGTIGFNTLGSAGSPGSETHTHSVSGSTAAGGTGNTGSGGAYSGSFQTVGIMIVKYAPSVF